jgi:hypothetical protein
LEASKWALIIARAAVSSIAEPPVPMEVCSVAGASGRYHRPAAHGCASTGEIRSPPHPGWSNPTLCQQRRNQSGSLGRAPVGGVG